MIVQRPLVHGAALPMIGKQPEADFELIGGKGGDLNMDRVVADDFVPRLDLQQNLAGLVLCLPGFVDLDAGRRRHHVKAGLLADHPAADQARVTSQASTVPPAARLRARRHTTDVWHTTRPKKAERHEDGEGRQ